jgi:hypothetical protein
MAPGSVGRYFTKTILSDLKVLNKAEKFELMLRIWPNSGLAADDFEEKEYTAFLDYIEKEASRLRQHHSEFATESIDTTLELITDVRANAGEPKSLVLQRLRSKVGSVHLEAVTRSLELTARLWLTINIDSPAIAVGPVLRSVDWPEDSSLRELVQAQFTAHQVSEALPEKENIHSIDDNFNAASLVGICGVKIHWTHNLADHLNFDKHRGVLSVYEHKICLINHLKDTDSTIIPYAVLQEAIDTLNLLFPFGNLQARELLSNERKPFYGLGFDKRKPSRSLGDYCIWRSRLYELMKAFNEPPTDFRQLISDRRKLMDWVTLWIGLLVLILTIVSIASGTVSSVYAIKQYDLALAQACSVPEMTLQLERFCK